MFKISKEKQARDAAARWRKQYPENGCTGDKEAIYQKLVALGDRPDPSDVDNVIGNTSWTDLESCSECDKKNADFVIQVGKEPGYESSTVYLCGQCIFKAYRLGET